MAGSEHNAADERAAEAGAALAHADGRRAPRARAPRARRARPRAQDLAAARQRQVRRSGRILYIHDDYMTLKYHVKITF